MDVPAILAPRLASVAEMQAAEKAADAAGHSYAEMMERAGRAVAAIVAEVVSKVVAARPGQPVVLVLAGPGNNGGDGLVCAAALHEMGIAVRVYVWKRSLAPEHDAGGLLARLHGLGVPVGHVDADPDFALLRAWAQDAVIVDALLGTGANRPIEGQLAALLQSVQALRDEARARMPVVAVDCASGLDCDTGAISPAALAPDRTVTFAVAKHGHYQFPGADWVGSLTVADIGIDARLLDSLRTFVITPDLVRAWLPPRPRYSHKGTFGKVLLAVGSESFPGAAFLSCSAAARSGAGLVTGAVPKPVWPLVAGRLAEPTWLALPVQAAGDLAGWVEPAAGAQVAAALPGYDALVLGCGLGNNKATRRFVDQVLRHQTPPAILDADGLNLLAGMEDWQARLPAACVLTPHPAEMARLCNLPVPEVTSRRWALARERAQAWRCAVLLKGPYTVVADAEGWLGVLPIATPALATAGSGDVLAGIIGGLIAQGLTPFVAACVGAYLHGAAGLRCEQEIGAAGVLAADLLPRLPGVIQALHTNVAPPTRSSPSSSPSSSHSGSLT